MKLLLPFHLQKVGAGFPSPATDYVEDDIDLNSHLIKNIPSTFLIRVQGKSMKDVDINDDSFKGIEAIIHSMTIFERKNPKVLDGSRRRRSFKKTNTNKYISEEGG